MRGDLAAIWPAIVLAAAGAAPALADMQPLMVIVRNASSDVISCKAEIAHWFSADLADIGANAATPLDLWRDPETGTVATRNAGGEYLPVERVWCGIAGRAYVTRALIDLPRADGAEVSLICTRAGERLECR